MSDSGAPSQRFAGHIVVVTGSSSGLGRAIAMSMARHGADVVIHGNRHRAKAEEVADEVRRQGRQALVVMGDLADEQCCGALIEQSWQWQ